MRLPEFLPALETDSSDDEVFLPSQHLAARQADIHARSVQLVSQVKAKDSKHKTFLVRSLQHPSATNLISPVDVSQAVEVSDGETSLSVEGSPQFSLQVAKVFDKDDTESLKSLNEILEMRQKLVGRKFLTRIDSALEGAQESLLVEEGGAVHYFPQGYTMLLEEHCENGDLLNFAKNIKCYSNDQFQELTRKVFFQLLKALNTLHHEEELCLLNLSLTNILLDRRFCPKISNLSRVQTLNQTLKISNLKNQEKLYLAPEIVNPDPKLPLMGDKVDIFALGVMLFTCLFQLPPFAEASPRDPFYRLLVAKNEKQQEMFFKAHPALKGVELAEDLKRLLKDTLCIDPTARLTARELLANPWLRKQQIE